MCGGTGDHGCVTSFRHGPSRTCGGNYRLIVAFKFTANVAFVKFIGMHNEYDRINALDVNLY